MKLSIQNMHEEAAKDMLNWKYNKPYDFYNNECTDEELKERLNGTYFAIVNDTVDFYGFFCVGESAQVPMGNQHGVYTGDFIDIGLGMNPEFVGKGSGFEFCSFIVRYVEEEYKGLSIRLTVAKFNHRAIHLYKKLGFIENNDFNTDFAEFLTMVKS